MGDFSNNFAFSMSRLHAVINLSSHRVSQLVAIFLFSNFAQFRCLFFRFIPGKEYKKSSLGSPLTRDLFDWRMKIHCLEAFWLLLRLDAIANFVCVIFFFLHQHSTSLRVRARSKTEQNASQRSCLMSSTVALAFFVALDVLASLKVWPSVGKARSSSVWRAWF